MDNKESGTSILEFSLVLPLLVLFLFGIIQYGWIFATKLSLMNTTATAARYSTVGAPRPTQAEVQKMFMDNLMSPAEAASVSSVTVNENVNGVTDLREVKVVYNLKLFFPFIVPNNVNGVTTLTVFAKMR